MGAYLDRYLSGECQPVWDELVGLGSAVREEPLYSDALAVARETMRRAQANIETLIPRLAQIGYRFGYGWVQPYWRERMLHRAIPHGAYTFADRAAYQDDLDMVAAMPPLHLPGTDREEQIAALDRHIAQSSLASQDNGPFGLRALRAEQEARPTASAMIAEYEAVMAPLPLALRAWYESVAGVNFAGEHDGWAALLRDPAEGYPAFANEHAHPMHLVDPLFVLPLDMKWLERIKRASPAGTHTQLFVTSDDDYKYLEPTNDPYMAHLGFGADAMIYNRGKPWKTFVSYLRECFQWGGFPGWAKLERRPDDDLAFLTQGLLPL